MATKSILLADGLHINDRNFKSFLAHLRNRSVEIITPDDAPLSCVAYGVYESPPEAMSEQIRKLLQHSDQELTALTTGRISLISICRSELLSALLPNHHHLFGTILPNDAQLVELASKIDRQLLIKNLAAAYIWINYWKEKLKKIPGLSYIASFSGSLTYARALLETAKLSPARCFVLESLFTGQHYFCEERYSPIPNNTDFRHDAIRDSLPCEVSAQTYDVKRNAALKIFSNIKNKNVQQPSQTGVRLFSPEGKTLVILGQVINDFSLIETQPLGLCSINIYKTIIRDVLRETEWNIIFKAHPWENKKNNVKRALTKESLDKEFGHSARYRSVENHSLRDLFEEATAVLCINSQAGLEAAYHGYKPIQVGRAFWGRRGYSTDIDIDSIGDIPELLKNSRSFHLTWTEYCVFEKWWLQLIDRWIIEESTTNNTEARLRSIFFEIPQRNISGTTGVQIARHENTVPSTAGSAMQNRSGFKKFSKLLKNPKKFCVDSKYATLRKLSQLLP